MKIICLDRNRPLRPRTCKEEEEDKIFQQISDIKLMLLSLKPFEAEAVSGMKRFVSVYGIVTNAQVN
jgi:hypothetical protein